jgi:hypothetical protein
MQQIKRTHNFCFYAPTSSPHLSSRVFSTPPLISSPAVCIRVIARVVRFRLAAPRFPALSHAAVQWQGLSPADEARLAGDDFDKDPVSHPSMADERFDGGDFYE